MTKVMRAFAVSGIIAGTLARFKTAGPGSVRRTEGAREARR